MNAMNPKRRALVATLLAGMAAPAAARSPARPSYAARADVQQFIDELVNQHGFDRSRVERWLNAARYSETVERLMQPPIPFGQRNWLEYRARYLEDRRIQAGAAFWRDNSAALERAEARFGVPAEVVVAIIGVETFFGRIPGNFRTIDALATLSFDYLRRADYYRKELVELLLLAREQQADPLAFKGSFAGAIGLPQFMPGSIRRFAVDFDGDGRIDLAGSAADAIGSVANFLVEHGWQREQPILFEVEADEQIVDALGRGIQVGPTWSDALMSGVTGDAPLALDTPVIVIDLPYLDANGETQRLYRVGTVNFSAVLHYNRSYFYATTVVELAQALRREVAPS
jgi:membrane-bound lytic murein transglycosylase B